MLFLIILTATPLVSAQLGSSDDAFGDIFDIIVKVFSNLAQKTLTMPIFGGETTYLALFASFLILFSLVWIGTSKIPPFRDSGDEYKGARKTFSIALSILVSFGSPLPVIITQFMNSWFRTALMWGMILGGILLLWSITSLAGRGFANVSKYGAESKQIFRETGDLLRDSRREGKSIRHETDAIRNLRKLTSKEIQDNQQLIRNLEELKRVIITLRSSGSAGAKKELLSSLRKFSTIFKEESLSEHLLEDIRTVLSRLSESDVLILKNLDSPAHISEYQDIINHYTAAGNTPAEALAHVTKAVNDGKEILQIERNILDIINLVQRDARNVETASADLKTLLASPTDSNLANAEKLIDNLVNHIKTEENYLAQVNRHIVTLQQLLQNQLGQVMTILNLDVQLENIERRVHP